MNASKLRIAVIMPAHNEATVIKEVIQSIPDEITIASHKFKVDIIVVNDGSRDNTAEVVASTRAILINHILQSGAGAATRTGLVYCRKQGYRAALTMDSDGQHDFKDGVRVLEAALTGKGDFVIGSRLINTKGMPWYKIFGNKLLNLLTFILFGVSVTDTQSGMKALNEKALAKIDYHSNTYAFCSEMIWKAKQLHLDITEIPIKAIYTDYSMSRGQKNISGALNITKQLLKRRFLEFIDG